MFKQAKLQLTITYVSIIMAVTFLFSFFVYSGVTKISESALKAQRDRLERRMELEPQRPTMGQQFLPQRRKTPFIDEETIVEIRSKTLNGLVVFNIIVLIGSASAAYFLAHHTLKPIEIATQKQKRFISDAAHDLKTPLTSLKTQLEVALRSKDLDIERAKKALAAGVEETDSMNNFINKLLTASKYQHNGKSEEKIVDVAEVLKECVGKFKAISQEKGQTIELTATPAFVKADHAELCDLFSNLIDNAIKFSPGGSVIKVSAQKTEGKVVVSVTDSGVGIEPKDLPNIFEPFFRGDNSRTNSQTQGHGLGLSICKDIVSRFGGTIGVDSVVGRGSVFTVIFPAAGSFIPIN